MFQSMKPSTHHRFLSVPTNTRIDITWPTGRKTWRERIAGAIFGGTGNDPSYVVDRSSFRAAVKAVGHDPAEAANGFAALGYQVTCYQPGEKNAA